MGPSRPTSNARPQRRRPFLRLPPCARPPPTSKERVNWMPFALAGAVLTFVAASVLCVGLVGGGGFVALWGHENPNLTPTPSPLGDIDDGVVEDVVVAREVQPQASTKVVDLKPVTEGAKPQEIWNSTKRADRPTPKTVAEPRNAPAPPSPRGKRRKDNPPPTVPAPLPDEPAPRSNRGLRDDIQGLADTAFEGRLSTSDRDKLSFVSTDDDNFTPARTLLYLDAKARGERNEMRGHLDLLMSLPANQLNPALLRRGCPRRRSPPRLPQRASNLRAGGTALGPSPFGPHLQSQGPHL